MSEKTYVRINTKRPVKVKGYDEVAHIIGRYSDIKGGVILDRDIDGFHSWNVKDLEYA